MPFVGSSFCAAQSIVPQQKYGAVTSPCVQVPCVLKEEFIGGSHGRDWWKLWSLSFHAGSLVHDSLQNQSVVLPEGPEGAATHVLPQILPNREAESHIALDWQPSYMYLPILIFHDSSDKNSAQLKTKTFVFPISLISF